MPDPKLVVTDVSHSLFHGFCFVLCHQLDGGLLTLMNECLYSLYQNTSACSNSWIELIAYHVDREVIPSVLSEAKGPSA